MRTSFALDATLVRADSTACFRPLYFRAPAHPNDDWIVGHEASDTTVAIPESGVIAIQRLQSGESVAVTYEAVRRQCGEDIDVADLVTELARIGLVAAIDGRSTGDVETIGQGWLARIPSPWAAWLFTPPALWLWGALIVAGPLVLLLDPSARPHPRDLLWAHSYTLDILTLTILTPLLLLKHELGHLLAARAKGLACELTVGNRLFYLVVVSRIAGIWKLPRRYRVLIYLAGVGSDCVMAGALALVLAAATTHLVALDPGQRSLLRLLMISEYIGIPWQLQIFMKTDVYHLIADLTGRHDLPERARALLDRHRRRLAVWLWSVLRGGAQAAVDAQRVPLADGPVDRWVVGYACLQAVGVSGSMLFLLFYLLPATVRAIQGEVHRLALGIAGGQALAALDGGVALSFQAMIYGLLIWSVFKRHRKRRLERCQQAAVLVSE